MIRDLDGLARDIGRGDRAGLSRAITLIESTRCDHREQALELLDRLRPATGKACRIGVSGVPGVGKSTFLDAFGMLLVGRGHKPAVLAVDPSSRRSGGSILADKSRMPRLAACPEAYIRPTPSRGELGGVAAASRETIALVEAAGFDVILVETVGVGQSETVVADLVDLFLLLVLPGAGDEFQGIKKGVLEFADILAVTKADGDNLDRAREARRTLSDALRLVGSGRSDGVPPVHLISAIEETGLKELWVACENLREQAAIDGRFEQRRRDQRLRAFETGLDRHLRRAVLDADWLKSHIEASRVAIAAGECAPDAAASAIVAKFMQGPTSE